MTPLEIAGLVVGGLSLIGNAVLAIKLRGPAPPSGDRLRKPRAKKASP